VHVRGQQGVNHVGGFGAVEAGVERAPGVQGGDDPGLASVTLPADLGQQPGCVGIDPGDPPSAAVVPEPRFRDARPTAGCKDSRLGPPAA